MHASRSKGSDEYRTKSLLAGSDAAQPLQQALKDSSLRVLITVLADTDPARMTPDFGGQKHGNRNRAVARVVCFNSAAVVPSSRWNSRSQQFRL